MTDHPDDPMRQALRELRDAPNDDVTLRRVRARVLHPAAASQQSAAHWRWRFAAACLAVMVGGGAAVFLASREHDATLGVPVQQSEPAVSASSVSSVTADNARWRSSVDAAVESIILEDGTLRLHVNRQPGSKRVIVRVPDGEIEDMGTIFEVVVREHRTVAVRVDDGRVTLRLATMAPLTLHAGESWTPAELPPMRAPRAHVPHPPPAATSPAQAPADAAPSPSPERAPAAPSSAAEDAAYLAFIRAVRSDDAKSARTLAEAYLHDYPEGFRREEVRRFIAK